MKFLQLNLRAYGPFTNKTIDFDDVTSGAAGNPSLHIILGANEAGKSTALRALRAVLFGMNDMRDAYLHPKDMLRVGLKVQTAEGEVLNVERRKGKGVKSLLFAGSDKAVPVEEWARVLPVDNAELFEQMFGLNYERLLEGGRQLAEFKSDIGQALLAAAGDLGQTVTRMREMQERADTIYSPRATSSKLRQALSAYQSADKAFRDARYSSREYKIAVARRDEIEEELKRIATDRAHYAEEQSRLTRLQAAAPHVHRLLEDEKALEELAASVLLATDFEQRYNAVITALRGAEALKGDAASELERLAQELASVPRDAALASLAAEIDQSRSLSGKILAAHNDCPKREAEWKQLCSTRDRLCLDLGVTIDTVPRLLVEQRKRIELLSGQKLVVEARRAELPGKIAGLELALREAESALSSLPAETDTAELAERLAQVKSKKQPEAEARRLRLERDQFAERLNRDLSTLQFWQGTADQLERLRVPLSASVGEFAERFVKHEARALQQAEEQRSVAADVETRSGALRFLERQQLIPTESELRAARSRRNDGWTAVKERWLQGLDGGQAESRFLETPEQSLPDAYESAVQTADSVADRLRLEADRVEQKRAAIEALAAAKQRVTDNEQARDQHRGELAQLETEWNSLWSEADITPRSPREMQSWLEQRRTLVEHWRDLNRLNGQVIEAEAELSHCLELLSIGLGEAQECTLTELVSRASARVREAAEIRKRRGEAASKIRQLQSNLDAALEEQRGNESELEEWRSLWAAALRGLPVSGTAAPDAVQEVLRLIDRVFSASDEMAGLQYRIEAMNKDDADYVEAVRGLALRASRQDLAERDALLAIGELQAAARVAESNETKVAGINKDQARSKKKLSDAQMALARNQASLEELRKEARADHANVLPEVIRASQVHRELATRIRGHRTALTASCGNVTLDEFIVQIKNANLDLLPAELERAHEEISLLEDAKASYVSERDGIDKEFQLREAATALSQASCEKLFVAARIDALAGEYLEQQIGATLLAKAMALYRQKNQDPLLKLAGNYFATLTCGAFTSLAIEDIGNQRVLRGVRDTTGEHLDVDAMSDGTRDQLFLALRLAYIESHCDKTAPCPVILDDVLMAFDDARTGAALRALKDLSRKTQVMVFTHHEHHVAIANKTLGQGGYYLHELAAPTAANVQGS
jgi:uncharacterized protein YhaN